MRSIRHPFSGSVYDLETNGAIRVTAHDGRTGLFRSDGSYLSGDLYFADPHLCGWIGGREVAGRHRSVGLDREQS
jgi:hypothetical protein